MAIELTFLGTGCPRPDPARSQAALLLDVDGERYLVDCGDGAVQQLARADVRPAALAALLLTHLHVDHCFGLAPFLYARWYETNEPPRLYGPSGTDTLVEALMRGAYAADAAIRVGHGRDPAGLHDARLTRIEPGPVLESDVCRVSALEVFHRAPSETYALKFEDSAGRVVVLSSDTGYCEPLAAFARDADLLVHECYLTGGAHLGRESAAFRERMSKVHVTPEEAGAIGRLAAARALALTHLPPGADDAAVAARAATTFGQPVTVARDFLRLRV